MTDLDKLIEAVEAGTADKPTSKGCHGLWLFFHAFPPNEGKNHALTLDAYRGSLDAAKALHDALLPGWPSTIETEGTAWTDEKHGLRRLGHKAIFDGNPARAWLLAILKAHRSQVQA